MRRIALWYVLIVVAIAVALAVSVAHGVITQVSTAIDGPAQLSRAHDYDAPVAGILAFVALCTIGIATALAASFNRETNYANFTFVRPVSRMRMAALIAAVDLGAIVAGWVFTCAILVAALVAGTLGHVHFVGSPATPLVVILGLGAAIMWYAMLQLASAWAPARSGQYVGIAAAVFGTALGLSHATFLGPVMYVFQAILYIDPLAYFESVTMKGGVVTVTSLVPLDPAQRALAMYTLSAAALVAATYLWKRVEV